MHEKGKESRWGKVNPYAWLTHLARKLLIWAFNVHKLKETILMEHICAYLGTLYVMVNDTFVTKWTFSDRNCSGRQTSGNRDMLMPACDVHRYFKQHVSTDYHDNCANNLENSPWELEMEGAEYSPSPQQNNLLLVTGAFMIVRKSQKAILNNEQWLQYLIVGKYPWNNTYRNIKPLSHLLLSFVLLQEEPQLVHRV
jgi:hypothetical protein